MTVIAERVGAETLTVNADAKGIRDIDPIPVSTQIGTFNVRVQKAGYADWAQNGVVVKLLAGTCDPATDTLVAVMQKQP